MVKNITPPYKNKGFRAFNFLATLGIASLGLLMSQTSAEGAGLSFNWSFVIGNGSTGQVGETVSGTISGLQNGSNDGNGLAIVVTDTPTDEFEGLSDWSFLRTGGGEDAFIVTDGEVTLANALFLSSGPSLFFGGFVDFTFIPQLVDLDSDPNWFNVDGGKTQFTPLNSVTTPEPSMMVATVIVMGATLIFKKKK
ncbi:MAG: hypothetical protein IGQ45_05635 [Cyanobacterium sp. T60_A2020_053]|nr:hypothetical protein [Cyanobacterium sp. T60_A2020_053]